MRYEDTSGSLRALCDRLFSVVEEVSGERPYLEGDWYKGQIDGSPFVYLRVVGERAWKYPRNSVHLAAEWDERLVAEQVVLGNNWWGGSADLTVQAAKPNEIGPAEDFIRAAFRLKRAKI